MTMTIDKDSFLEMMKNAESKKAVKSFFKEILLEEPTLLKELLKEILEENDIVASDRRKKIEAMIDEDFDKYDEVFKALA